MSDKHEDLLIEIRENFDYALEAWEDIFEESDKDMKYLAGDPWDEAERKSREDPDSKRPILTFQELTQYTKQVVNSARLNPISIKISPDGMGANDKTAELRQGIIRNVEYQSKAQAAYITGLQGAVERGFGFFALTTEYEDQYGNQAAWTPQTIKVRRIPNPRSVLIDPDYKEADASDITFAFILNSMRQKKFKKEYKQAKITNFGAEQMAIAPKWIEGDNITVAEYWKLEVTERTLLLLDKNGTSAYLDEIEGAKVKESTDGPLLINKDGQGTQIQDYRKCKEYSVCQYITNGLEILEENPWPGRWIPIIPVFGEEMYVDFGSGVEKKLMSLIRPARDPFMMYCWLRSNQAEEGSMTPKAPFIGAEGQFEGHENEWQMIAKQPKAYIEYKAKVLDMTGEQPLPPPSRPQFTPNFEAYEMVCESTKRAIQSAIGMFNTSVGKHDTAAQSGKAIEALDTQSSEGSFHFIDNYKRALELAGRMMDDLLNKTHDTQRTVGVRNRAGQHGLAEINVPDQKDTWIMNPETQDSHGKHLITVSTGPSFESQRQEAQDFMEQLAKTPQGPMIMDLLIKARDLGELGDEMADRVRLPQFSKEGSPEKDKAELAQLKQQNQQLQDALHKAVQEIATKQAEQQAKIQVATMEQDTKTSLAKMEMETKLAIAEITTKAQIAVERSTIEADIYKQLHSDAHEAGMQASDQSHEKDLQASQQEAAAQSQAADQAHDATQSDADRQAAAQQQEAEPAAAD